MVKICSLTNYPNEKEEKYKEYFEKFNYPLHIFQKWAIEGIVEGQHVLCCCPTGSGKSLPAEFALDYFHSKGKKTIYCSPIKSLSNQKFNDFTQKYPHVSVGIVTGDIRCNPDASVLVMTTEILLNKLYQLKSNSQINSSVSFEMDIENELGCVIFDEIHYIGNEERGHVWENSIMLLPRHIQMIGLSATLDDPEKFAYWLENRGENITNDKIVYLTSKKDRAVPLIHYSFITTNQGIFKAIKDKALQEEIKNSINKPFIIQDHKNKFNDENYFKMVKMLKLFEHHDIRIKRAHILNQVTKYLTENEMTPAICYLFSIKQIELCAKEITTNLLEFDSKVPYIARRECEKILREKLPNFEEYLHLPEYLNLVSLLEKGIATHHSKMLPVLREIVEIFFAKGYIKLLFATESVAIGLNLPVKTCIFTDVYKHDGTSLRILQPHEYTQSAGRSGRLGLDTVGHVLHLNNLFRNTDSVSYKTMMNGKPQILTSKFKISYNLLLNLIAIGDNNITNFAKKSMITGDLDSQMKEIYYKISTLITELDNIKNGSLAYMKTPKEVIEEYSDLQNKKQYAVNKKRKDIERKLQQLVDQYKTIESDMRSFEKIYNKEKEIHELQKQYDNINNYIYSGVHTVLDLLQRKQFIILDNANDNNNDNNNIDCKNISLMLNGKIASQLREIHCLVFAKLFEDNLITNLTTKQLIALFSCFTNLNVQDDYKDNLPKTDDILLNELVVKISNMYIEHQQEEIQYGINTGIDYTIHYDLLNYTNMWCDATNVEECKLVLQKISEEKEIFLGEFVKALLKINNISCEMEKIAEITGNIEFLSKLKEIPNITLKYVVTNQSLYV
jgi:superfamily II RNA helicase